jgi:hypothetical protein
MVEEEKLPFSSFYVLLISHIALAYGGVMNQEEVSA